MGLDGLAMLAVSNLVLFFSMGFSLLLSFHAVLRAAIATPAQISVSHWILVPGVRLQADQPVADFTQRLARSLQLFDSEKNHRLILLGGWTQGSSISEATAGQDYLVQCGIPEGRILLEQRSLHTLENFLFARQLMAESPETGCCVIITNRYHLARCSSMASYIGIDHVVCAAEDSFELGMRNLGLVLREAYLLHWYYVGRCWARVTMNRAMRARLK